MKELYDIYLGLAPWVQWRWNLQEKNEGVSEGEESSDFFRKRKENSSQQKGRNKKGRKENEK